jgi:hypothetical protein
MPLQEITALIGRQVMLTHSDTGEYHVFGIDAATPTVTVLHPVSSDARAFAAKLPDDTPLRLSVSVTDGLIVANVLVDRWSPVGKVLTVRNASSTDLVQRRSTFRVPVALPVQVAYEREREVVLATGQTIDVSERGLALTAKGIELEGGELTAISIQMRSAPLLVVARVVLAGDGKSLPSRFAISQILPSDTSRFAADLRHAELNMVRTVVDRRGA